MRISDWSSDVCSSDLWVRCRVPAFWTRPASVMNRRCREERVMGLSATLLLFAAAAGVFLLARHRYERPYRPGELWRLPWLPIMFVAALVAVIAFAQLLSLATGTPLRGRAGF